MTETGPDTNDVEQPSGPQPVWAKYIKRNEWVNDIKKEIDYLAEYAKKNSLVIFDAMPAVRAIAGKIVGCRASCFKCRFWESETILEWYRWDVEQRVLAIQSGLLPICWRGRCRRFPPWHEAKMSDNLVVFQYPETYWDHWCGEFSEQDTDKPCVQ